MEVNINLRFDNFGNLMPYEKTVMAIEDFYSFFVTGFKDSSTRKEVFKNYIRYIEDFCSLMKTESFVHYIGGSFITNKQDPLDIDIATFVSANCIYKAGKEKRKFLFNNFITKHEIGEMKIEGKSKEIYKVDAFLVPIFPQDDERFKSESLARIKRWQIFFSFAKNNKPAGFIQIIYDKETLQKLSTLKSFL